ncbi:MAG TPA: T9SS type A sorting domain-containing protein [Chitinophagales bacterium]|nr:T9SS type A sorting domain-containing protein [Chitinophagales bacterium]
MKWSKNLGGSGYDFIYSAIVLDDGGVAVTGYTSSNDVQATGNHGLSDVWVAKLNSKGDLLWSKCYGGPSYDGGEDIAATPDGGFVVVGYTSAEGGDVTGYKGGSQDGWLIRLNENGELIQQRCTGGSLYDHLYSIDVDEEGNYAIGGSTMSGDGDVSEPVTDGWGDAWLMKMDASMGIVWNVTEGSYYDDNVTDVLVNSAGNYSFCIYDECCDASGSDFVVQVYNPQGTMLNDYFVSSYVDYVFPTSMIEKNGDHVLTGYTSNFEQNDIMAAAIQPDGTIKWKDKYGELSEDYEDSEKSGDLCALSDGRFLLSGSDLYDFNPEAYLHVLDAQGVLVEQNEFGGSGNDQLNALTKQKGKSVFAAGFSTSSDGDVPANFGLTDGWVVKFELADPQCTTPEGLMTTSISSTLAKMTWNAVAGASSYKCRYKKTSNGTWIKGSTTDLMAKMKDLIPNTSYVWQVKSECGANPTFSSQWSAKQHFTTAMKLENADESTSHFVAYPNPLSEYATIAFTLLQNENLTIALFNAQGRKIKTIAEGNFSEGNHQLQFEREDLPPGIYMLQLLSNSFMHSQKLVIQ